MGPGSIIWGYLPFRIPSATIRASLEVSARSTCPDWREVVKGLLRDFKELRILEGDKDFLRADVIWWLYGPGPPPRKYWRLWLHAKPLLITHWEGTDVLYYLNKPSGLLPAIRRKLLDALLELRRRRNGIIHLAVAPWLIEELSPTGISAKYLPISRIDTRKLRDRDSFSRKK